MLILPISRLQDQKPFPLDAVEFDYQVTHICEEARKLLLKKWLPSCADIFLIYKKHWRHYIPTCVTDSTDIVDKFFNCANMLMSTQLRWLVMKSLNHLCDVLIKFKVPNFHIN